MLTGSAFRRMNPNLNMQMEKVSRWLARFTNTLLSVNMSALAKERAKPRNGL